MSSRTILNSSDKDMMERHTAYYDLYPQVELKIHGYTELLLKMREERNWWAKAEDQANQSGSRIYGSETDTTPGEVRYLSHCTGTPRKRRVQFMDMEWYIFTPKQQPPLFTLRTKYSCSRNKRSSLFLHRVWSYGHWDGFFTYFSFLECSTLTIFLGWKHRGRSSALPIAPALLTRNKSFIESQM